MAKTNGHQLEEILIEDIFDEDFYHLQMADKELQEAINKKAKMARSRYDCHGKAYDKGYYFKGYGYDTANATEKSYNNGFDKGHGDGIGHGKRNKGGHNNSKRNMAKTMTWPKTKRGQGNKTKTKRGQGIKTKTKNKTKPKRGHDKDGHGHEMSNNGFDKGYGYDGYDNDSYGSNGNRAYHDKVYEKYYNNGFDEGQGHEKGNEKVYDYDKDSYGHEKSYDNGFGGFDKGYSKGYDNDRYSYSYGHEKGNGNEKVYDYYSYKDSYGHEKSYDNGFDKGYGKGYDNDSYSYGHEKSNDKAFDKGNDYENGFADMDYNNAYDNSNNEDKDCNKDLQNGGMCNEEGCGYDGYGYDKPYCSNDFHGDADTSWAFGEALAMAFSYGYGYGYVDSSEVSSDVQLPQAVPPRVVPQVAQVIPPRSLPKPKLIPSQRQMGTWGSQGEKETCTKAKAIIQIFLIFLLVADTLKVFRWTNGSHKHVLVKVIYHKRVNKCFGQGVKTSQDTSEAKLEKQQEVISKLRFSYVYTITNIWLYV